MRLHRYWSEADIVELRKLAASGRSLSEIAEAFNRTASSISSMGYKLKIKIGVPKQDVAWTDAEREILTTMRKDGHSYLTIAKRLGRTRRSAIGAGNRLGLSMPVAKAEIRVSSPKQVVSKTEYVAPDGQRANLPRFDMARIPDISKYMLKGSSPKPLVERQFGECCFPVAGDSDGTLYCCEPVVREKKYCKRHYRVMYVMRT